MNWEGWCCGDGTTDHGHLCLKESSRCAPCPLLLPCWSYMKSVPIKWFAYVKWSIKDFRNLVLLLFKYLQNSYLLTSKCTSIYWIDLENGPLFLLCELQNGKSVKHTVRDVLKIVSSMFLEDNLQLLILSCSPVPLWRGRLALILHKTAVFQSRFDSKHACYKHALCLQLTPLVLG